jgi:hypothetical protein
MVSNKTTASSASGTKQRTRQISIFHCDFY